jgi:hypothetical protein
MPLAAALMAASWLCAQSPQPVPSDSAPLAPPAPPTAPVAPEAQLSEIHPIAIVPLDSNIPGHASEVTGDLQVYNGRAFIAANAAVTAGSETTHVTLPNRGTLLVCTLTSVKLTSDSSVQSGEVPGLLMAMDHGAVEMNFATTRNSDSLLTPDFRILISGPGAAEVKVRLGPEGDTCVDNTGANAPYVLVSSVFDGGAYRVQPGQRVMFQHGSMHEVVDQEKEPCGCPPAAPSGNEFPLAQSEGLAPLPNPVPAGPSQNPASAVTIPPLVYKSTEHAPQTTSAESAPAPPADASATAAPPKAGVQKKPGFFRKVGRFFKRVFGAEEGPVP